MDLLTRCIVCMKESIDLVSTYETDTNNIKWSYKLYSCVPELEWNEDYRICHSCSIQLEAACAFRVLCLQSMAIRKQQINYLKNEDNIEYVNLKPDGLENFYTDYFLNVPFISQCCAIKCNEFKTNPHVLCECVYCDKDKANTDIENYKFQTTNVFYNCLHCSEKFRFKSHRDAHVQSQHASLNEEYVCFHCHKSHKKKSKLITHLRIKHSRYVKYIQKERNTKIKKHIKPYQCKKCLKYYTKQNTMKAHYATCVSTNIPRESIKVDVGLENLVNNNAEKGSRKISEDISVNTRKTDPDPSRELDKQLNICKICGMVFSTRYLAKRHLRNVHATEKNYQCDMCDQKFASPVYLNAHKRYHSGERPHICSFCGKGFITGSDLYHHEKIHANKRAYKCDKCPKAFNTSSDLHKHKLCVHQDRNQWKYVCTFCDRRFPLKTNLDAHTKTHTGERNFACHLCERRCVNRSVLLRHIKSHSNVRLFKCTLCSMEYKYQKSLDIHMTKTHGIGDAKIPERIKKYFCHICPKSYFANNKLQKHIRTHTGERPFSCEICQRRFIDKSYVKQHLKTAHNIIFSKIDLI